MPGSLLALILLGAAAAQPPAPPSPWPLERYVRWQPAWGSQTIAAAGLTAHVALKHCGQDRPASEACSAGDPYLVATVDAPGMTPAVVQGAPSIVEYIGIGKLTADSPRSSLILISDDGGSGGCVQIDLAVPQTEGYRSVRLSVDKSDHGTLCEVDPASLAWPRDLTGHGRPEFRLSDTRFSCLFTSCAGTWYPPRIVAFDGQGGLDVSSDPALVPLYRADMIAARRACEHATEEAQGACAGYAADAARIGELPQAWRVIQAQVRRGCRVQQSGICYDSNRIPVSFPADLAPILPKPDQLRQ